MKILVTGAIGNVGSAVMDELLKRGVQIRALTRKKSSVDKVPSQIEVAIGDLLDSRVILVDQLEKDDYLNRAVTVVNS